MLITGGELHAEQHLWIQTTLQITVMWRHGHDATGLNMIEAQQYPRALVATDLKIVTAMFFIDTAGRDSGGTLGGVPDARAVD